LGAFEGVLFGLSERCGGGLGESEDGVGCVSEDLFGCCGGFGEV
jgi:hypothetical protein